MSPLEAAKEMLDDAGYQVRFLDSERTRLGFEDQTVFGFVMLFESTMELINRWEEEQDTFIRKYSRVMQNVREKAWNAYSVFLVTEEPPKDLINELSKIEEDFHASRKIARGGLQSTDDVRETLAPLLPIKHLGTAEDVPGWRERFETRSGLNDQLRQLILGEEDEKSIVKRMLDSE
jgi:hypothetical protein